MQETRILIVEDDAVTAMDIKDRLEKFNYTVVGTTHSGKMAIALSKQLHPNAIIMDIVLKGDMDGIMAAEIITKTYGIPIIFLTGYADAERFNRAKSAMPYGYVTKPFNTRDLQGAIELAMVRKNYENKLIFKEKRFQLLMDNATCGLFTYDAHGLITDINKLAARIMGRAKKEVINKDFREFVVDAEKEYATLQIEKLRHEKHIGPNVGHMVQPSGAIRTVEFSSVCVKTDGGVIYLAIIDDVTEKNILLERSQLADKMSCIGALTLGIIHEINNPLMWLLSNLQFIKEKIKTLPVQDINSHQLLASLTERTNESIEGAQKIAAIIYDLKGFSHVDEKNLIPVDIVEALNAAIHIVAHEIKQAMKIKKEFCEGIPLLLLSTNRIQQVFMNLIMNAAQAFINSDERKNTLIIKTILEKDYLRIEFIDNGSGISPEHMKKLFTPFFTTKQSGVGVGLGLSISYAIIHDMGGEIFVNSKLNSGATFTITLPLNIKAPLNPLLKIVPKTIRKLNVLIVDDLPNILKTLRRLLEEQTVTEALGGREALRILSEGSERFDLIIIDINMPDVNGIDLYRYVKHKHPKLTSRIIFLTGSSSEKVKDFLASVDNPYLEKPFSPEELSAAIERLYPFKDKS